MGSDARISDERYYSIMNIRKFISTAISEVIKGASVFMDSTG